MPIPQHPPADATHHRPVPPEQLLERDRVVTTGESTEQFAVGRIVPGGRTETSWKNCVGAIGSRRWRCLAPQQTAPSIRRGATSTSSCGLRRPSRACTTNATSACSKVCRPSSAGRSTSSKWTRCETPTSSAASRATGDSCMPHEPQKFLHDLLDSARFLVGYTADRKYEDYLGDRGFRSAVERELITIGEAVLRLHKFEATLCARISEYQRIISFRNILVHGYDAIKPDLVWLVVTDKLRPLIQEAESLLQTLQGPVNPP